MLNFFPIGVSVFGGKPDAINGCTTIHSATNDNGFLDCARSKNPSALAHDSTSRALNNLFDCSNGGVNSAHIVGHGSIGAVVTGTTSTASDHDWIISLEDLPIFKPLLEQLAGRVSSLTFWACYPGAAENGADFLFEMAKVVMAPVAGPTGVIYCNDILGFYLEGGATWQIATPNFRPPAIDPPGVDIFDGLHMKLKLNYEGQFRSIPLGDIVSVEFVSGMSIDPDFKASEDTERKAFSDDEARSLLSLVKFDEPFQPGGVPAAMVTGRMTVGFRRDGQDEQREFIVYNDLLLQDRSALDTFYRCHNSFRDAINLA
jgi:hypothetical protein